MRQLTVFRILTILALCISAFVFSSAPNAYSNDGGVVEGTVQVDGVPLAGVEVFLGIGIGEGSEGRHVCTEADGTFRFEDVPLYEPLISATGVAVVLDCPNASFVDSTGRALLIQYWDHINMTEGWPEEFNLEPGNEQKVLQYDVVRWPSSGNNGVDKIIPRVYEAIHDHGLDSGVPQEARGLLFRYMERVRTRLEQGKLSEEEADQLLVYADFVLNMGIAPEVFRINPPFVWPRDGSAIVTVPAGTEIVINTGWAACTKGLTQAYTKQSEILLTFEGDPLVPDLKASRGYWGPVEPRYVGPENACVNGTNTTFVAYWRYHLGILEPGEYFVEFSWGVDHLFHDGGDYDGDGKPDMGIWGGETAFTILVTEVGGISGYAYDEFGMPIEGLDVVACEFEGEDPYCDGVGTEMDGYYEMWGLPPGAYRVFVYPQWDFVEQFYDQTHMWHLATPVDVVPDEVTPWIDFHLIVGGSIPGYVYEEGGGPLEGLDVIACDIYNDEYCWGEPTDGDGYYQIIGLPPSEYRVFVYSEEGWWVEQFFDHTDRWDEATPVEVFEGTETDYITFDLIQGGSISGWVVEAGGGAIPGLDVMACTYPDDDYCWGEQTDEEGFYTIGPLTSGEYVVSVYPQDFWMEQFYDHEPYRDKATPIEVIIGEDRGNVGFDLTLGGAISGRVYEEGGGAIQDLDVLACDYVEHDFCWGAMTEGDGSYFIGGLPPSEYRVFVYQQENWIEQFNTHHMWWQDADEVEVTAENETMGIDFDLVVGGSISGHVTDQSFAGLEDIEILACNASDMCRGTYSGEYGYYSINGVHDDIFKILVQEQSGWLEQFYYLADWGSATPITISGADHIGGIDFHLFPQP